MSKWGDSFVVLKLVLLENLVFVFKKFYDEYMILMFKRLKIVDVYFVYIFFIGVI